jgi:cell division protein FtsZ
MKFSRSLSLLRQLKDQQDVAGIVAFGAGSAGCRILSFLHRSNIPVQKFVYVSTDEDDLNFSPLGDKLELVNDNISSCSPSEIRCLLMKYRNQIESYLLHAKVMFVISGLGGSVGSGISPLLAKIAKEMGVNVIGIVAMPFIFEKTRHFYAGVALRQMKKYCDSVMVIDNDFLLEHAPKSPMLDMNSHINERISVALSKIIEPSNSKEVGVGLKKVFETIDQDGYSILSIRDFPRERRADEAIISTANSICSIAKPEEANKAIAYLLGDSKVSTAEIASSVNRLELFGNSSIEIQYGISGGGGPGLTTILLTSGFRTTKFDDYDPIAKIFKGSDLEDDLEMGIDVELPLIGNMPE